MLEAPKPLLVYNRIEANRRRTRRLLALFALAVLPFTSGIAVWLAAPVELIFGLFAIVLVPSVGESIKEAVGGSLQRAILVEAGLISSAFFLASLGVTVVTTALIYRYSSALILRAVRARPTARDDEPDLHRIVENLCVGAGLPKPRLYLIESSSPNAFATGRNPQQAAGPRELP